MESKEKNELDIKIQNFDCWSHFDLLTSKKWLRAIHILEDHPIKKNTLFDTFGPLISFMYFRPTKQTSFLQDHPMNIPTKRIRLKCRNLRKKTSSTTTYAK